MIHPSLEMLGFEQLVDVAVDADEGVLQRVFGIIVTHHYTPDMPIERLAVGSGKLSKGRLLRRLVAKSGCQVSVIVIHSFLPACGLRSDSCYTISTIIKMQESEIS